MTIVDRNIKLPTIDRTVGWHPDPDGIHNLRYFDGVMWTNHVTHFGPTPCQGCRRR